jgi:hypothetical protein
MGRNFDRAVAADDSGIEARRLQICFRRATGRSSARSNFPWVARGAGRLARRQVCFRAMVRFSFRASDRLVVKAADCSALPADDSPEAVVRDRSENAARRRCRIVFRATVRSFACATDPWAARGAGRQARRVGD